MCGIRQYVWKQKQIDKLFCQSSRFFLLNNAVVLSFKKNIFQLMFVIKLNLINYMTGKDNQFPDIHILVSSFHLQVADANLHVPDGHLMSMMYTPSPWLTSKVPFYHTKSLVANLSPWLPCQAIDGHLKCQVPSTIPSPWRPSPRSFTKESTCK